MKSPIDQLVGALWGYCVTQRAPQDQETLERWQTDEVAQIKEGFTVQTMPDNIQPLVEKAIAQWEEREKIVCSRLKMDRELFLNEFQKARESFLKGENGWEKTVLPMGVIVYGVVRNLDWVNLFSWMLPAADPENSEKHRIVGRMVTAIFYTELLSEHGRNPQGDIGNPLARIEARWRLVNQQN